MERKEWVTGITRAIGCEPGEIEVGVTFDPMRDEMFYAARGEGAFLNENRIHVSTIADKRRTLLATGFPFRARGYLDEYLKTFRYFFNNSRGIRRAGSATLDLAYVAVGRIDAFWEATLSPWDMAAGVVLVEEAGGRVTDVEGKPLDFSCGRTLANNRGIVASNAHVHADVLAAVGAALSNVDSSERS